MTRSRFTRIAAAALLSLGILSNPAFAELLGPFKDRLFAYPQQLGSSDGGRHVTVDYHEMRDINGRDEIPERRVESSYVDLKVRRQQADLVLQTAAGRIPHMAVGSREGARFIVLYLHGKGGNRQQGMNDYTFGGNFNRIKNLAVENGGLYLTMDFSDFEEEGAGQAAALLSAYMATSPSAPVFVACGSMGGGLCWRLAENARIVPRLGGLLLLGSFWNDEFLASAAFRQRIPVFIGHGGNDSVFPVERQEAFFRSILAAAPGYPVRFVRFETGSHGTPIRMVDWRGALNWMDEAR